jgi:hypothetical protein
MAAAGYVDVISTNYGADWTDGRIAHYYFDTLHKLTGKPILVSEFYFAAMENRSGNRNSNRLFPTVETQAARADSFRTNLTLLASLPYIVGAHWFQYYDEPTLGRPDGEDFNMGLVDINDRPYDELVIAAATVDAASIHSSARETIATPDAIPRAPADPESRLRKWDLRSSLIAAIPRSRPFADLHACWDEDNLYLAVHGADFAEKRLYRGDVIPKSERAQLVLWADKGRKPVRAWFGPGSEAVIDDPAIKIRATQKSVRFTTLLTLPASRFAKKTFQAGDRVPIRAMLFCASGAGRTTWNKLLHLGK